MSHLRILTEEPEEGYDAHGMIVLGETEDGEVIVDCCRNPKKSTLSGKLYRKDISKGGKRIHRCERATGKRKQAIKVVHRFLGEEGT